MINFSIFDCLLIFSHSFVESSDAFNSSNLSLNQQILTREMENNCLYSKSSHSSSFDMAITDEIDEKMKNKEESLKIIPYSKVMIKYNPDRFEILLETFPKVIFKEIAGYDYNDPIQNVYDLVMRDLKISHQREELNFYSRNFAKNLIPFIRNVLFPNCHPFWYNLQKLLFKWMIYRREETTFDSTDATISDSTHISNDNENSFQESLQDISLIVSIIENKIGIVIPGNFNLKSMNGYTLNTFKSLFKCEFLENNWIFHYFADAIKEFHDAINSNKDIESACQLLKINHFNGHFDRNILFKYLILFHAPIKEMKDCILEDDSQSDHSMNHSLNPSFDKEMITREYLMNLRIKGPENLKIDLHFDGKYLNKLALKFIQANDQRIEIKDNFDIFRLLRMLNREGLLTWNMIKNLAGFPLESNGFLEWNQGKFKKALKQLKKDFNHENEMIEFEEYLKKLYSN